MLTLNKSLHTELSHAGQKLCRVSQNRFLYRQMLVQSNSKDVVLLSLFMTLNRYLATGQSNMSVTMQVFALPFNCFFADYFLPLNQCHATDLFLYPRKHQKSIGFLMFSRGIESDQWHEIG